LVTLAMIYITKECDTSQKRKEAKRETPILSASATAKTAAAGERQSWFHRTASAFF
jgi:hypothetical protein